MVLGSSGGPLMTTWPPVIESLRGILISEVRRGMAACYAGGRLADTDVLTPKGQETTSHAFKVQSANDRPCMYLIFVHE
jgi:hypothetical protein